MHVIMMVNDYTTQYEGYNLDNIFVIKGQKINMHFSWVTIFDIPCFILNENV